jgi:hypothetical protein
VAIARADLLEHSAIGEHAQHMRRSFDLHAHVLPHQLPLGDTSRRIHRIRTLGQVVENRISEPIVALGTHGWLLAALFSTHRARIEWWRARDSPNEM